MQLTHRDGLIMAHKENISNYNFRVGVTSRSVPHSTVGFMELNIKSISTPVGVDRYGHVPVHFNIFL